jgi:hypothetical protein
MADLEGGTTGQVLSKASNADMDFTWVAQDDSNAIQNAIVDAKGDLIAATAADTPARLAVGTDGQVLSADSTAATGLKWITSSATGLPAFSAYSTTNQSLTSGVWTKVTYGSEDFDTNSNFASSRFTPTVAGYYQINASAYMGASSGGADQYLAFYKNGANYKTCVYQVVAFGLANGSVTLYMNGSTDYVEVYAQKSGVSPIIYDFSQLGTWFNGVGVRG